MMCVFLFGCSETQYMFEDEQYILHLANQTCIYHSEKLFNYESPTIEANYFKVYCLSRDRQNINKYIYLRDEYDEYKKYYKSNLE